MKIAIITCYRDPDYVRARTLRSALQVDQGNEVIVVKNSYKNMLRYPEVIAKLIAVRIRHNPDVYLLTFRGYELLPFFNLLTIGKKRIFDEFINLVEWVVFEHHKFKPSSPFATLIQSGYRLFVKQSDAVLTDTASHADYSANLLQLPRTLFHPIPVSTDEALFRPRQQGKKNDDFQVFYYGNMLPLHGLQYVLEAAMQLRDKPIHFLIVGGKEVVRQKVEAAQKAGAHITYQAWMPFDQLPDTMAASAVFLGGPFGNTLQSSMVITGKTYQSLAMGVPTLIGETKETGVLADTVNCLMVPQADAPALAEKLSWAYEHPNELQDIGRKGREVYERHYSQVVVARLLRDILSTL